MIIGEFCDVYPPELDGVGMVMKSYVEELTRMGDECYYVAPRGNGGQDCGFRALLYHGLKMPHEPYHVGVPALDPGYLKKVWDIQFDIVHAHSPFAAGREALRLAKHRKIPIVATFHSKYYDDFYEKTHSRFLAEKGTNVVVDFYNECDEVWAVSEKTAQVLHDYGYQRRIHIMANGTNPCEVLPADITEVCLRYKLRDDPVFLFVGQMNWKKNIRRVLEAAAIFGQRNAFQLVMAGQGPNEQAIREYALELGIAGQVVFTGHISDRRLLMALFARADMLVFPSLYDNAPMVVREAASVRTASIVVRGSCAAECIVDGENGLLSEDTSESIAACMETGLREGKRLGENAQKTIPIAWPEIIRAARGRYVDLISKQQP